MNIPLSDDDLDRELTQILNKVFAGSLSEQNKENAPRLCPGPVLILPPDTTRIHSRAGFLAGIVCRELARRGKQNSSGPPGDWSLGAIMPALGTHRPLGPEEIKRMFSACPANKIIPHRWNNDTVELGRLEADWVASAFTGSRGGPFHMDWPVQVNRILRDGLPAADGTRPFSLIISIGQVVPHEIAGMANHAKNIFVGAGGEEAIHKSHWLGALYGLERLMGVRENPVRSLFDEALRRYGHLMPPILWILTVVDYRNRVQGLFCSFGRECFEKAAALSEEANIQQITGAKEGIRKAVVWLEKSEYRSTWLGNKAIYRTRRAMADGGELMILAPGLECFGEDPGMDALIRRYGYRGTQAILRAVEEGSELPAKLSAAAHLIHGSSEGRFVIRYCTTKGPGLLGQSGIEGVGYEWGNLEESAARYVPQGPDKQHQGWNTTADGERYYFIRNPGMGLWVAIR
ncbi:MAG: D-mannonate epimerase [Treponema sp.]|nr:D-mannonate epimerase [Treponema sp.]